MQLLLDKQGGMKIMDTADLSGDFDGRVIFKRSEKRQLAKPLSGRDVATLSGLGDLGLFGITLPPILQNVVAAAEKGVGDLATGAINYGISALIPRDDSAAAAQSAAQAQALALETQKAVTAQQQAAAALEQAKAYAAKAASGAGDFMTQYKVPLIIGGGLLAALVGLKVAKVI